MVSRPRKCFGRKKFGFDPSGCPERARRSLLFEGLFEASTFPPVEKGWGESEEDEKGGIGSFPPERMPGFNLFKKKTQNEIKQKNEV